MSSIHLPRGFLSDVASAWLPVLFDAAVKSVVVLGLACAVVWMLRRRSAAARHLVWSLAVASLPALAILSALLPGWNVLPDWAGLPVEPGTPVAAGSEADVVLPDEPLATGSVGVFPSAIPVASASRVEPLPPVDPAPAADGPIVIPPEKVSSANPADQWEIAPSPAAAPPAPDPGVALVGPSQAWDWQAWCFVAWLAGIVVAIAPLGLAMLSLRRVERRAERVNSGPLASLVRRLAAEMRVKRPVRLLLSDRRSMPMQWGVFRPKLLLPASAEAWTSQRLRIVLLHELAHVRRGDCLVQLIARAVCALFWFNPLAWVATRRMQLESEAACDDLTLGAGFEPSDYAEHVLQIASGLQVDVMTGCAAIAMARPSRLEGRLLAILDPKRDRRVVTRTWSALALAGLASVVIPLAMLHAATGEAEKAAAVQEEEDREPERAAADPEAEGPGVVRLSHVDDSAEGKRSLGGSGHAVKFERPKEAKHVTAVQIFASRYGLPEAPDEDFYVYLLDGDQKVIKEVPFAYGMIERGQERWYTLKVPVTEVPERFHVALSFDPHRTKGIYVGIDEGIEVSHSLVGLPEAGFTPVSEAYDWMVRVLMSSDAGAAGDPFALGPVEGPVVSPARPRAEIPESAVRLSYVDDSAEGRRSIAGSGHAVKFERPKAAKYLAAVQIFGSRYGHPEPPREDFYVYLLDQNRELIGAVPFPYGMIRRGRERWYTLMVPATEVPEVFYVAVAFNPHQTKGVYMGLDEGVESSHSYTGLPSRGFQAVTDAYDWMIRAYLVPREEDAPLRGVISQPPAPKPAAPPRPEVEIPEGAIRLSHVGDASEDKRSIGGSGHAIAFTRPADKKRVVAIQMYASRYGLPQPPDEDFHVYLLDQRQNVLKDLTYPYALIERGPMRWYTLEVPAVEVPEDFWVALSFNPHQTKGIYLGLDKNVEKAHSYTGLPSSGFSAVREKSDWMVRVFLLSDADGAHHKAHDEVPLRYAQAAAEVARAELQQAQEANRRHPGTVPPRDMRQLGLALEQARRDVEQAEVAADDKR